MGSWATRFRRRQNLKGSLWALPLCGGILGVLLAELLLWVDSAVHITELWHYSSSTATSVLTAIISAMVALLGFVVTIGVLVIQQATATLSPRFMRLWYRDRLQKIVLATFAGTFTYSFALLRRVDTNSIPDLGITIAGFAVGISLIMLLIYLNRFTHTLRPVAVAAMVEKTGEQVFDQWQAAIARQPAAPDPTLVAEFSATAGRPVTFREAGAIQAIHASGLIAAAEKHDCLLVLRHTVGDFVAPGDTFVEIKAKTGESPSSPDPEYLRGLVALGVERTIEQDPAFALRVLVDIGIKALSPAINDPTTTVQILDYIEIYLHRMRDADLRDQYTLLDGRGIPRVIVPGRTWAEYVQLAVTEIRTYGGRSVQVCRRLRSILDGLLITADADHQEIIRTELSRLDDSISLSFSNAADQAIARASDPQGIGAPPTEWAHRQAPQR